MDKKILIRRIAIIVLIMLIGVTSCIYAKEKRTRKQEEKEHNGGNITLSGNYNIDLIKSFNNVSGGSNYLISPYNIEIALNMLRDGADGTTKDELDKVLGDREINDVSVKDKVGIANGVFIKDIYKDNVKTDYYDVLNTKYKADIIYDEFNTPDKINNWVNEKTNGMIPKILDQMNKDYVMGLASALAIDVEWEYSFECNGTTSEEFTKKDNTKMNTEMMHKTYESSGVSYIKTDDAEGIIIPYQQEEDSNVELEFVGILPNNGVEEYINNLTSDKLNALDQNTKEASNSLHIHLSLPRFKYDYDATKFKEVLQGIGINDAFNPNSANFKKMVEIENYNVYVGEAIHKTHIELNEKGTKAAAITYFGMFKNSALIDENKFEEVIVKFNKPFLYMIREKNTKEILFFGTVYEPNTWNGSTCQNINELKGE